MSLSCLILASSAFVTAFSLSQTTSFFVVNDQSMSWDDAGLYCSNNFDSTLARVSSSEHNDELKVFSSRLWLSGTDADIEDTWIWEDGTNDIFWLGSAGGTSQNGFYTNWVNGIEPNNGGGIGQNCLITNHLVEFWDDETCTNLNNFACNRHIVSDDYTLLFSRGSYGIVTISSFNEIIWSDPYSNYIIRRECLNCASTHQDIYYRRFVNPTTFNYETNFLDKWTSIDNVLNNQFKLYSTIDDALNNQNGWNFCNYADFSSTVAFPRDCGPNALLGAQWNSLTTGIGQQDYRFSLYIPQPTEELTLNPTGIPTGTPTAIPTTTSNAPTSNPTKITNNPTQNPTLNPTVSDCTDEFNNGDLTIDYEILATMDSTNSMLNADISSIESYESGTIDITVTATSKYIVNAHYGDVTDLFGVTYVLDTFQFEDYGRKLGQDTNICENRYEFNFTVIDFEDLWSYSLTPGEIDHLANSNNMDYLEYPLSSWTLTNDGCNSITWEQTFSFNQLVNDCSFIFDSTSDPNNILLTGTFYLTLVSPNPIAYNPNDDSGQYATKQIVSHQITISLIKQSNLINDGTVQLYGTYIISADYDRDTNKFELTIMTYVPNYLQIDANAPYVAPEDNPNYLTWTSLEDDSYGSGCLIDNDDYRCWQKFIVSTTLDDCPSTGYSFDNEFQLLGGLTCLDSNDLTDETSACYEFMNNDNEIQQIVDVQIGNVDLTYTEGCDTEVYEVDFGGTLSFCTDSTCDTIDNDLIYSSDGATVFMIMEMDSVLTDYTVLGVEIISVSICTADVADGESITSCTDSEVDLSSNYDALVDANLDIISSDTTDNFEIFSIHLPLLSDDRFFVEVIAELTYNPTTRRRLKLLQNNQFNKFQNVIGSAKLTSSNNGSNKSNNHNLSNGVIIGISVGSVLILVLFIGAVLLGINYIKMKKALNEKEAMEVVSTKITTHGTTSTANV